MRARVLVLLVVLCGIGIQPGCATTPNPNPPRIQQIQAADSVVTVLGTLSRAIQHSAEAGYITIAQAHQALDIIKAAALTLRDTPEGGYAVAIAAVNQISATVSPDVLERLGPYLMTARAALETFRRD